MALPSIDDFDSQNCPRFTATWTLGDELVASKSLGQRSMKQDLTAVDDEQSDLSRAHPAGDGLGLGQEG